MAARARAPDGWPAQVQFVVVFSSISKNVLPPTPQLRDYAAPIMLPSMALARWRAPLRTMGAAPELCGDDGDGGGARTCIGVRWGSGWR
jgi:hypothetical protein